MCVHCTRGLADHKLHINIIYNIFCVCERYVQSELYRRLAGLGRPRSPSGLVASLPSAKRPLTMAHASPIPAPASPKFGSDPRSRLIIIPRPSSHIINVNVHVYTHIYIRIFMYAYNIHVDSSLAVRRRRWPASGGGGGGGFFISAFII